MIIDGKVGVVFGGAQGIGKAYCEALLQKGAKVCFSDISQKEGDATEKEFTAKYGSERVCFLVCDIQNEEQIIAVFEKATSAYGQIEIAVNNVGIVHEFDWKLALDINMGGNIRCVNTALKYMGLNNGGRGGAYVCTSSISGLRPESWGPVYSGTKHGVIAYVRSWAHEENLKNHGIRMNCICPTRILTNFVIESTSPERMYHAEEHLNMPSQKGHEMSANEAGNALVKVLEEDINGKALRLQKSGIEFAQYEEQPLQ